MSKQIKIQQNQMKEDITYLQKTPTFSQTAVKEAKNFLQSYENYAPTPLVALDHLASHLKVKNIFVKDESKRFGLNAFKVLGGIYAIARYLAKKLDRDIATLSFQELKSPEVKAKLGELTFISATDGNHGKGVAWAARELGHQAVIYLPKGASIHRVEAIKAEGATAEVTSFNYDESVRLAAQTAAENDWIVLQDTAWEGYEEIPEWIMQGYAVLGSEIVEQMKEITTEAPTHLFLQAGVGSYAASIAAHFLQQYSEQPPKIVLVEPAEANCFYQSFVSNEEAYAIVSGNLQTIMAGLSCGEPNPVAWELLKRYTDYAVSSDDVLAAVGMRVLGNPVADDPRIIAGESGAVTTGLVYTLLTDEKYTVEKMALEIGEDAKIVVINTEGDTDPENYRKIVWEGAYPYEKA